MHLYMLDYLDRQHLDVPDFFRLAHIWRFGRDVDVSNDVAQFRLHAIIPPFVREYVKNIQHNATA